MTYVIVITTSLHKNLGTYIVYINDLATFEIWRFVQLHSEEVYLDKKSDAICIVLTEMHQVPCSHTRYHCPS
jgi:hypothetical protein